MKNRFVRWSVLSSRMFSKPMQTGPLHNRSLLEILFSKIRIPPVPALLFCFTVWEQSAHSLAESRFFPARRHNALRGLSSYWSACSLRARPQPNVINSPKCPIGLWLNSLFFQGLSKYLESDYSVSPDFLYLAGSWYALIIHGATVAEHIYGVAYGQTRK